MSMMQDSSNKRPAGGRPAVQSILTDIEGTTTSISFAVDVLFPLSHEKMEDFVQANWDTVRSQFPSMQPAEVIATLRSWIQADKKETRLKSIQGKIWKTAFESGKIKGHLYPDVAPAFRRWKNKGLRIAIYSSGSIEAQQLIFRFSTDGDLTKWIDDYFDTTTGPKREAGSYRSISEKLNLRAQEILFLSDVAAELNAAGQAGMQTIQLLRENAKPDGRHRTARSFAEILPEF